MAVFRIERTRDYTVMSNHHLRNGKLSLKAKGLLSMMLSLPEDWNYTTRGLAAICKEGVDAIGGALRELEAHPELVTKLQKNALYLRKRLSEEHIRMRESNGEIVPIIPIYTYEPVPTLTIAKELYDAGVYVNSSLPPAAAPHECLLRTSLMATHTTELIDEAVGIMKDILRRHEL